MKTERCGGRTGGWLLGCVLALLSVAPEVCLSQTRQPIITSIRPEGTNIVVAVRVPEGVRRVTLESRRRFGAGTWAPAAVARVNGAATSLTFKFPLTRQSEMLRVRADAQEPLPANFYTGTNRFWAGPTNNAGLGMIVGMEGGVFTDGTTPPTASTREVVESDIWRLNGDRLYFFNQYRGLQVIDITDPDAAAIRGSLTLPASGEQMYLAGPEHVVLLARNGCGYYGYYDDASQVILVSVANDTPQVAGRLPIPGSILESRMVGTALYVASQAYRSVPNADPPTFEWGTLISAFDLADPAQPVTRNTLWFPGYGNVVAATDTYLFVATQDPANWYRSAVQLIDITSPDGTMAAFGVIQTTGRVNDKFKLNYTEGIFTSISEDTQSTANRVVTRLETFRLPDPRAAGPGDIAKLGQLELGGGEQLHATRFDGNRVYVVTFFRIDPLWVVDLSDPAKPLIAGSVDVPGWSTYIQPLGNRLVTVGVEDSHVAVSLFGIANPTQPALSSRVLLGESYSWSEANNDEKAFTVLPEIGLILVPYSGDTTNGWTSQVQLIDLNPTTLVARGIIQHQFQPRRATFSHDRILSLSGWELLSVDATDRAEPVVRGGVELSWPVDRVFVQGDFLLEIEDAKSWWGRTEKPAVRVTPREQPDRVLGRTGLGDLAVAGAALKDNRLYVVQSTGYPYAIFGDGDPTGGDAEKANFVLTVFGLDELPKMKLLGQVKAMVDLRYGGGKWQAVWPKANVVVWAGSYNSFGWWGPWGWPFEGGPMLGGFVFCPVGLQGGGQLLAFDVSLPTDPKLVSQLNLATNDWLNFSQPLCQGTSVYLSHQAPEQSPDVRGLQRSYVDVINYEDPASPTLNKPANIPGTLQGVFGELLYTTGYHWDASGSWTGKEWLDASAYDGVEARLIDSLALPETWPHPVLAIDGTLYLGRAGASYDAPTAEVETWSLPATGKFTQLGTVKLTAPANTLFARGGLLAVQQTDRSVSLFDPANPAALRPVGHGSPAGCVYFDLDQADGNLQDGLWIPLEMYGVGRVGGME